jgi:hypothetical protein
MAGPKRSGQSGRAQAGGSKRSGQSGQAQAVGSKRRPSGPAQNGRLGKARPGRAKKFRPPTSRQASASRRRSGPSGRLKAAAQADRLKTGGSERPDLDEQKNSGLRRRARPRLRGGGRDHAVGSKRRPKRSGSKRAARKGPTWTSKKIQASDVAPGPGCKTAVGTKRSGQSGGSKRRPKWSGSKRTARKGPTWTSKKIQASDVLPNHGLKAPASRRRPPARSAVRPRKTTAWFPRDQESRLF